MNTNSSPFRYEIQINLIKSNPKSTQQRKNDIYLFGNKAGNAAERLAAVAGPLLVLGSRGRSVFYPDLRRLSAAVCGGFGFLLLPFQRLDRRSVVDQSPSLEEIEHPENGADVAD